MPSTAVGFSGVALYSKYCGGGKYFDFQRATVFCLGHRLSKHKTTGAWPLGPPGYAYGRFSIRSQSWRTCAVKLLLFIIWRLASHCSVWIAAITIEEILATCFFLKTTGIVERMHVIRSELTCQYVSSSSQNADTPSLPLPRRSSAEVARIEAVRKVGGVHCYLSHLFAWEVRDVNVADERRSFCAVMSASFTASGPNDLFSKELKSRIHELWDEPSIDDARNVLCDQVSSSTYAFCTNQYTWSFFRSWCC